MRSIIALGSALLLATLTSGCAVTPSYGPAMDRNDVGYREQAIEADRYRVSYRAADAGDATDGALRRAAEITVQNGYDYFTVVSRDIDEPNNRSRRPSVGIGGSTGSYGRSGLGIGVNIPVGAASPLTDARIEIVLGRGVEPAGTQSYNARDVLKRLVN